MRDIVTGVQGAEAAVRVLERALSEAETTHRTLRVLTVWSTPPMVGDLGGLGYGAEYVSASVSTRCAQELVDTLLDKALHERHSGLPVVTATETHAGDPGRALVEASKDAGLVVVGGRGHGALASALLGSTTGYVVHHARCPVMVVPDRAAPGPLGRVVVGLDGEGCSRSALLWGLDAAARHRCPLHVVHATNILPIPGPNVLYPDYDMASRSWLKGEVDQVLLDRRDVEVIMEVLAGPAARVLLGKAGPDDLLVVGSRGRGGFTDLVLGSVATQCTTHARGAVVVVREHEERLDTSASTGPRR
jgi:nucleotide-binding universal stress UspA family protein